MREVCNSGEVVGELRVKGLIKVPSFQMEMGQKKKRYKDNTWEILTVLFIIDVGKHNMILKCAKVSFFFFFYISLQGTISFVIEIR